MMAALAAGCVGPGAVAMDLGAETAVLGCGEMPLVDLLGELSGYCDACGGWLGMAVTQSTAVAPEVVRRHYGWSPDRFEEMADQVPPGADGLMMLPYVSGERTPRLRDGTGVLHGITPDNFTAGHLARATIEGVALGLAYALSRLRDLGLDPAEIRLTGATAGCGRLTRQILADATGLPVVTLAPKLDAAAGAAMHATVAYFRANGESLGFGEIARYLVTAGGEPPTRPDPQRQPLYQNLLSRQQYLVETLYSAGFL
ncbi:MAG: FGGY-family carbohydrate kinase [Akkermansiaceae bacterium]|nr:FGGY-family carbohydrate kinase [Akkermansiaceae bacterium]